MSGICGFPKEMIRCPVCDEPRWPDDFKYYTSRGKRMIKKVGCSICRSYTPPPAVEPQRLRVYFEKGLPRLRWEPVGKTPKTNIHAR